MKLIIVLASLLTLATANPVALASNRLCYCEPPICPLELIAECKCKNAAAQGCYENFLAQGVVCPKPTPSICGPIARAQETATPALPVCGGFLGLQCPKGLKCVNDPKDDCDPKNGGSDCIGICVGPK